MNPKPKPVRMTICVAPDFYRELRIAAAKCSQNLSKFVIEQLKEKINELEKEE